MRSQLPAALPLLPDLVPIWPHEGPVTIALHVPHVLRDMLREHSTATTASQTSDVLHGSSYGITQRWRNKCKCGES